MTERAGACGPDYYCEAFPTGECVERASLPPLDDGRCRNEEHDEDEDGVDCGGSCLPCSDFCQEQTDIPVHECLALEDIYLSMGGPEWSYPDGEPWFDGRMPCDWAGVLCPSGEPRNVGTLALNGFGLRGGIPRSISQLSQLRILDARDGSVTSLPSTLGAIVTLTELRLGENQLQRLPPTIGMNASLTILGLDNNELRELPDEIGQLSALEILNLDRNRLGSLPSTLGELQSLTSLRLAFNQVLTLPDEIGRLHQLRELDLNNNLLSALPETIGALENLTELDADHNRLSEIPASVLGLTQLTALRFPFNQLTTIPSDIGNLRNLVFLALRENHLEGPVPPSMLELVELDLDAGLNLAGAEGCLTAGDPTLVEWLYAHDPDWTLGCECHPDCHPSE